MKKRRHSKRSTEISGASRSGTPSTRRNIPEQPVRRVDSSAVLLAVCCLLLFLLFLYLNRLTPFIADDYSYMFSYEDGSRIRRFSDVVPSMYAHCFTANGRWIPHTLEQLFLLLPKGVFDGCNAAVFVLLMYGAYRMANAGNPRSVPLFLMVSGAFICVVPAFGQIALWQAGSFNYLWGLLAGVILMIPYLMTYQREADPFQKVRGRVLFCGAAFFIGCYTEITSFVCTLLCILILLRCIIIGILKPRTWLWIPPVCAAAGYLSLLLMPAELKSKKGSFAWEDLVEQFFRVTDMLWQHLWFPLLIWVLLIIIAFTLRVSRKKRILSELFATAAILANYMLVAAAYYPERCMCTSALLLVLAIAVLLPELQNAIHWSLLPICSLLLMTALGFRLGTGVPELNRTYDLFCEREVMIENAKRAQQYDLLLPIIESDDPFNPYWNLIDLDTLDSRAWPNSSIAKYYKVRSILGEE